MLVKDSLLMFGIDARVKYNRFFVISAVLVRLEYYQVKNNFL
jgi:hypothetical protein